MKRSIILDDEYEKMLQEIRIYTLQHNCNKTKISDIIRACIKQTRDCAIDHYAKSLLNYFDE